MTERTRIDKWMWHARFFRSRALAQQAAASGLVRLNGSRVAKAGHAIKAGDIITIPQGRQVVAIRVLAIAERRRQAKDACSLYEIVAEQQA